MRDSTSDQPDALRAGAARVEITPKAGAHLAGGIGVLRPAQSVLDPLYAGALVLERGGRKICILTLDVTMVTRPWTEQIRAAAAELGFDHDAVMVHAVQTHSAPPVGHFMLDEDFPNVPAEHEWIRGGETPYYEFAAARAIEAIRLAGESLRPVQVGVGSAINDRVAFNRRGIMRDGKACMPWPYSSLQLPLGPTHLRCLEGPTDPEVGVMCFRDATGAPAADGRMVAMILHYTCHPVNVYAHTPNLAVSADWPGAWAAEMRAAYGASCVPLVLNGCCGNINPWPAFEADFEPDHRRMGRELAQTACRVAERMTFHDETVLDWSAREVPLAVREVAPDALEAARKTIAEHPQPKWSRESPSTVDPQWMSAALTLSVDLMRRREPEMAYEIQLLRVGDVALVGLPGEPFVEGQLRIKVGSPTYPTYVAHCTTHYAGYVPIKEAFQRGGHEVNTSYWAKLCPDALDVIVDNALELLKEVFPAA